MGIQMKGTLSLEGVDVIEHSVMEGGSISAGILELKEKLMGSINSYISEKHLSAEEVDLFEEKMSDDEDEPKKGTKRKSEQFQKKRQKGNPKSLGRRSR